MERVVIKAAAAGQVIEADLSMEGKIVGDRCVIHIDDGLDRLELENSVKSLGLVSRTLELTKKMLPGLKESFLRKQKYFKRMKNLTTASQTQKDNAYHAMVAAENQYLSSMEKELNLRQQMLEIKYKIQMLKDRIKKKNIRLENRYLYKLMARKGDYVSPGTSLAIVDDLSRGKLVIYLDKEEIEKLDRKSLWLNGKKSRIPISKLWKETDEKYISSYRAEIFVDPLQYPFSSLVKVELK